MAKEQKCSATNFKLTDEQRFNRICSILSIGVMRHIQAEKASGTTIHSQAGKDKSALPPPQTLILKN